VNPKKKSDNKSKTTKIGKLSAKVASTQPGFPIEIGGDKQAEEALRESEEKFRMLIDNSVAGIYIIQDSKMAYVNPSFAKTFGYSLEEIIGKLSPRDLIHPDEIQAVMRRLGERLEGETEKGASAYKVIKKDGSIIYIEVYGMQMDFQGRPAVMGTLMDITARKQAEEALTSSEAELRALFASMHDAVVVIDRAGVYRMIAPTNPDLLVKPSEDLLGKTLWDVFPPEQAETLPR